jgi:acetylornithine deacetylase/succinyl-diaminopimelate desuccinylase-like protein
LAATRFGPALEDGYFRIATTSNVLAESKDGDPNNVVMAGGHFDSVNEGPASTITVPAAALLEVAEQMAKVKPQHGSLCLVGAG